MRRGGIAGFVLASAACSSITGSSGRLERVVAQIEDGGYPPQALAAADTVQRGIAFPVSFRTFGNSCVENGDEDVSIVGRTAIVTPYDLSRTGGTAVCDDVGFSFAHVAEIRFDEPGPALIVLSGVGRKDMPVTIQRVVVVR